MKYQKYPKVYSSQHSNPPTLQNNKHLKDQAHSYFPTRCNPPPLAPILAPAPPYKSIMELSTRLTGPNSDDKPPSPSPFTSPLREIHALDNVSLTKPTSRHSHSHSHVHIPSEEDQDKMKSFEVSCCPLFRGRGYRSTIIRAMHGLLFSHSSPHLIPLPIHFLPRLLRSNPFQHHSCSRQSSSHVDRHYRRDGDRQSGKINPSLVASTPRCWTAAALVGLLIGFLSFAIYVLTASVSCEALTLEHFPGYHLFLLPLARSPRAAPRSSPHNT